MSKTNVKEKEQTKGDFKGKLLNKIKITSDNTAIITYTELNNQFKQDAVFTGKEEVRKEFFEKLQENKETLKEIVPFLDKWGNENITIGSIKIGYDGAGKVENLIISAQVDLLKKGIKSPLNISTPLIPFYKESNDSTIFSISGVHETIVHETIELAKAYQSGDTKVKQMSLVVDNENKPAVKK